MEDWERRLEAKLQHQEALDASWLPAAQEAVETVCQQWRLTSAPSVLEVLRREHPDVLVLIEEHGEGDVVEVIWLRSIPARLVSVWGRANVDWKVVVSIRSQYIAAPLYIMLPTPRPLDLAAVMGMLCCRARALLLVDVTTWRMF